MRVVEADAQTVDLAGLLGEPEAGSPRVLCGNLPYAITGALLRRAVEHAVALDRAVFMVQDEVADRLAARPGTKDWGALTVFVHAAFDVRRLLRAPPGAFHPPPEVTQRRRRARARCARRAPSRPNASAPSSAAAFEARRKTLRNAWSRLAPTAGCSQQAAAARRRVARRPGRDARRRGLRADGRSRSTSRASAHERSRFVRLMPLTHARPRESRA